MTAASLRRVGIGGRGTYGVLSGTLAARPAANAGTSGWYYATDNGVMYHTDGTTWTATSTGDELGYAEITANQSTSAGWGTTTAGGAAITGLAITVTAGARPFYVEAQILGQNSTAGAGCVLQIFDEANTEVARTFAYSAVAGNAFPLRLSRRQSVTAGTSKTYRGWFGQLNGGTAQLTAGATFPAFIRAIEA